jgi:hypothetical protein
MKGETAAEMAGLAQAERAVRAPVPAGPAAAGEMSAQLRCALASIMSLAAA